MPNNWSQFQSEIHQARFLGESGPGDTENKPETKEEPRRTDERKRANELNGKTWTKYSISIWSDISKTYEEALLGHPAMFPVMLAHRLIEIFTNRQDHTVFDPFVGAGSTVVAAKQMGKHGVGVELSPNYAQVARMRCEQPAMFQDSTGQATIHQANAFQLLDHVEKQSVDLVITSPPYWDILTRKRTADYKDTRHYGNAEGDLGTISDYQEFLARLKDVFALVYQVLRNGAYCCIIVMDIRKKNKFYPFHSDIAMFMQEIGFTYDDIIIWDRRHEYNNMRPLGYPEVFRVNKAHEFILIFQKHGGRGTRGEGEYKGTS
jgi:DNA modification methylase